jgi:hypothetical protein
MKGEEERKKRVQMMIIKGRMPLRSSQRGERVCRTIIGRGSLFVGGGSLGQIGAA